MRRKLLLFCFLTLSVLRVSVGQMPHDAIYMGKNTACIAIMGEQSSWTKYWENSLKRENLNIGTLTVRSVMPMVAVGITKKLNVLVGVPYVKTEASAGNLLGQTGFQDLALWVKYKLIPAKTGFSLHAIGGVSTPITNYVPDFLPLSIGMGSRTATARILANYKTKMGLYATASTSYIARANVNVDRDAYFSSGQLHNTNEVVVPNAMDAAVRIGWLEKKWQAELNYESFNCLSGDYIRRNDMPYPTNKMSMSMAGAYVKFQPKNIGFNARVSKVLNGQNVGQSTIYSLGLLYQLNNIIK